MISAGIASRPLIAFAALRRDRGRRTLPGVTEGAGQQPAGWYDDPSGRHDHRYWDGSRWTDHVSTDGITSSDTPRRASSPIADAETRATAQTTRAQRQATQRRAPRPQRRRWPWVLGGILAGFVILGVSCAAILGIAVNNAANKLNAEQRAHEITTAQFNGVSLGASQASVIAQLKKPPEDAQQFVNKGIINASAVTGACIYYNKTGGSFGNRFQFCFTNDALTSKNAY